MVDLVKLLIKAGNGGDGRISFHSNRYQIKGGPDGGDGGDGGHVIARASIHATTLRDYSGVSVVAAEHGAMGGKDKMHGRNAEDHIMVLPVGTRIWRIDETAVPIRQKQMYRNDKDLGRVERPITTRDQSEVVIHNGVFTLAGKFLHPTNNDSKETHLDEESINSDSQQEQEVLRYGDTDYAVTLIGDLTHDGQDLVIAHGGKGGRGNFTFRSSRNTTPMEAQTGEGGEQGEYIFELQVLADIGLVGFPNAGKSTLLSVLTKATPKIGNYPFTTLDPNLGVLSFVSDREAERRSLVIADIPGLIEGAHTGKGLGTAFLRHIRRCKALVFVIAPREEALLGGGTDAEAIYADLAESYRVLEQELASYETALTESGEAQESLFGNKARIVALNKSDLFSKEVLETISKQFQKNGQEVHWISAATRDGIDALRSQLQKFLSS